MNAQQSIWPGDFLQSLEAEQPHAATVTAIHRLAERLALNEADATELLSVYFPLAVWLQQTFAEPGNGYLIGINGAQGSGKSTASALLKTILEQQFQRPSCVLSIDDIYLTRAAREQLADTIHPLLRTRGVPGTHDLNLGIATINQLKAADNNSTVAIPRFDKALDDRCAADQFEHHHGAVDFILFEGWCVGAQAETATELHTPINTLEQQEDAAGVWRAYVNQQTVEYQPLFAQLDCLIMLKAPGFDKVYEWRQLQEQKLREACKTEARHASRLMDAAALERFIMHYERLTRHMLREMPDRADIVFYLGEDHKVNKVHVKQ